MEFYKIFEKIMRNQGLTIPEVARNCGLTDSTVRSIFDRKQKKIALNIAFKLSKGLGVSLEQLNGLEKIDTDVKDRVKYSDKEDNLIKKYRVRQERGKKAVDTILDLEYRYALQKQNENRQEEEENIIVLPLPLQGASAGTGQFSDDEATEDVSVVYNSHTSKADYILRVSGDSMEPKFYDGDLVLVRDQPAVEVGEIGIFIIDGDQYIKEYKGDYLHSLNPEYEDVDCTEDTFCRGKVLGVLEEEWVR